MENTTSKLKSKRLPKGLRTYVRRLKQEAEKNGTVYRPENQYGTAALAVKQNERAK
jgi:hypothetical protein